jgi:tetratricopeptide (TPR) repeat protein
MNTTATAIVSVLAASAAAVAVSLAMRPRAEVAPPEISAELRAELAALRESHASLTQQIDALRAMPAHAAVAAPPQRVEAGLGDDQVAAAVEAYLQQRGDKVAEAALVAGKATFDLEADFEELVGTNYWQNTAMWKKAFDAGRMEDVIAKFEELAEQSPQDVQAQMNLANAYMAYLQFDQTKWQYSMKADGVYDRVLALDNTHWEARFTKAVSYTFWPEFLGKKTEAVSHFETLVEQQELLPPADHHAETYLYLGNLLADRDPDRARQIWAKGAKRHPMNKELQKKLGQ